MKRVQINSRESDTNILLTYPTLDANKTYTLTVEKLTVPAHDSLLLNETLFSVERRLLTGQNLYGGPELLPLDLEHTTFTPQNIRTVSDLLYQMNIFFQEMCKRLATVVIPHQNALHQFAVPLAFNRQLADWYSGLVNPAPGFINPIDTAIQAIFRPDGKIGFRFSVDGVKLFVIRLTDQGQRVFSRTQRYIAVDHNGTFTLDYSLAVLLPQVAEDLPAAITEPYILICDDSLFSHVNYRHELVLETSLPLDTTIEVDTDRSFYRRQLASYRFPDPNTSMKYTAVRDRSLIEQKQTMYVFEEDLKTHNKFKVYGTDLQNFNVYLRSRSYEYDGVRYNQVSKPYKLHADTFYTVQFALRPIK